MTSVHPGWQFMLEGWSIEAGYYPDMAVGDRARFAVEAWFDPDRGQREILARDAPVGVHWLGVEALYRVAARVEAVLPRALILDVGIQVYDDHPFGLPGVAVGDRIGGLASLSIDCTGDVDQTRYDEIGYPGLARTWIIDSVAVDNTPSRWVNFGEPGYPSWHPDEGPLRRRIEDQEIWASVETTQAAGGYRSSHIYRIGCHPETEHQTTQM